VRRSRRHAGLLDGRGFDTQTLARSPARRQTPQAHPEAWQTQVTALCEPQRLEFVTLRQVLELPSARRVHVVTGLPGVDALIDVMTPPPPLLRERRDPRRFFHATYLRTTEAVNAELSAGGFDDPAWVERWDVEFARFYLDALQADLSGGSVPGPWAAAFAAAD